jgi:hypothetical protein
MIRWCERFEPATPIGSSAPLLAFKAGVIRSVLADGTVFSLKSPDAPELILNAPNETPI